MPLSVLLGLWTAAKVLELPRGTLDVIAKVLTAVTILVVSLALARLIAASVTSIALARQGVAANVTIFANITRVIVLGIGVLVMLQSIGVSITPLLGALGVGGLAVALALQDTPANLFAGVHVLASKTIEPGDYIKLATGQEGYVVDINWRNTSIRTLSDNIEVIRTSGSRTRSSPTTTGPRRTCRCWCTRRWPTRSTSTSSRSSSSRSATRS